MPDPKLVKIINRLDELTLNWWEVSPKHGKATCSNGYMVDVGFSESTRKDGWYSSLYLYTDHLKTEKIFGRRYLSCKSEHDSSDYDPDSELCLRSWIQGQVARAIEEKKRSSDKAYRDFFS